MELEIKPLNGIGLLEFGMNSIEVGKFNYVYGAPIRSVVEPFIYEFSQEEIDDLRSDLGEEGLKAILDASKEANDFRSRSKTEYREPFSLRIDYLDGKAESFQLSRDATSLSFDGHLFFNGSPRQFLAALQARNGEPPLVKGDDCVFRNINVYVWAAFEILPSGVVRFFDARDVDDKAQDKSIILSKNPRNENEYFAEYKPISFIR